MSLDGLMNCELDNEECIKGVRDGETGGSWAGRKHCGGAHVGYLATSGTPEAEDEQVQLEKEGNATCSWVPSLDLLSQMSTHVSPYVTFRY